MERSRRDRDREEDSDEDYVVVGTPLENEFESKSYRRQVKDPSVARVLDVLRSNSTPPTRSSGSATTQHTECAN